MLDWRALPLRLAATLAAGLSDDSRAKRALTGCTVPTQTVLLASIADGIHTLTWAQYGDPSSDPPTSILGALLHPDGGEDETPEEGDFGFEDDEALQAALYPDTHSAFEEVTT